MRPMSALSASRCAWVSERGPLALTESSSELTRVCASPAVGTMLGSRSTYRVIAQPCSAWKLASSRRLSKLTVPAIRPFRAIPLPQNVRFYAYVRYDFFTVAHRLVPWEHSTHPARLLA